MKVVLRITTKDWLEKLFWNTGPWIYWSNIKIFDGTRSFDSVIQRLCLWCRSKLGISYIEHYLKYLSTRVLQNGYIYKICLLIFVIVTMTYQFYLVMWCCFPSQVKQFILFSNILKKNIIRNYHFGFSKCFRFIM